MKIIIDIPDEIYKICKTNDFFVYNESTIIRKSIADGTPLPKGHGNLIDTNDLKDFCQTHKVSTSAFDGELIYDAGITSRGDTIWKPLFDELKPIIEAESEEE